MLRIEFLEMEKMYISKVISYGNAWNDLNRSYPNELSEIQSAIAQLTPGNVSAASPPREFSSRAGASPSPSLQLAGLWERTIQTFGWEASRESIENPGARPIHLRGLGFKKNRVAVSLQRHREMLNRWLYTLAPIATRNGYIDIPVAAIMLSETEESLMGRPSFMGAQFERTFDELIAISPLSHNNPFVLLGLSEKIGQIQVIELESETDIELTQIVVNRCIEFPLEYHQAGLGILNYFGTVLREKYPDHKAKVKIEQDGLKVRLIIESENGDREIIEKALQEYELVVRGEAVPESLFESRAKILELKSELRIAQVRIEGQRDIIEFQGQELATLKQIIGHSLSGTTPQPIHIAVSPVIHVSNSNANSNMIDIEVGQSLSELISHVQILAAHAVNDPSVQLRLLDLDEALNAVANKKKPEDVRKSGGVQKLKKFIDEANDTGSAVNAFLGKVSDGVEMIQKLARRYNQVAEWCGAPQVPSLLLGSE
jgi:hypothetical protein